MYYLFIHTFINTLVYTNTCNKYKVIKPGTPNKVENPTVYKLTAIIYCGNKQFITIIIIQLIAIRVSMPIILLLVTIPINASIHIPTTMLTINCDPISFSPPCKFLLTYIYAACLILDEKSSLRLIYLKELFSLVLLCILCFKSSIFSTYRHFINTILTIS